MGEFLKSGINLYIIEKVVIEPNSEIGPADGYLDLKFDYAFKKIQEETEDLESYLYDLIELMNMHLKSYDEKVRTAFNETLSSKGYISMQRNFDYSLVLKLCCFYDKDKNSVSFPTILSDCEKLCGFSEWLDNLSNKKKSSFGKAKKEYQKLISSKSNKRDVLSHLFSMRNKHWGHIDKNRRSAKNLLYEDLDVIYKKTKIIMLNLLYSILDRDSRFSFKSEERKYKKQATEFFNSLKAGQKSL